MPQFGISEAAEQVYYQLNANEWRRKQEISMLRRALEFWAECPWQEALAQYELYMDGKDEDNMRRDNR